MKEFWIYTAARLGLFVVAYAVIIGIYLLVADEDQLPMFWPFLLAVVVSAIGSAVLLRKQRDRFTAAVHQRAERAAARRSAVAAEEQSRRTPGAAPDETRDEAPGRPGETPERPGGTTPGA